MYKASAAFWSTGQLKQNGDIAYVTDGCFLYRTNSGKLLMVWSSFSFGNYAIGIAESVTGKIYGPWKQQAIPLFDRDGGHGMIFKSLEGKLILVFHGPNSPLGEERTRFFELEDLGSTLGI